jgi:hypothetical protein
MKTEKEEPTLEERKKKGFWKLAEFIIISLSLWVVAAILWDVFDLRCLAFVVAGSSALPIVLTIGILLIVNDILDEEKKENNG